TTLATYGYDAAGELTSSTAIGGVATTYAYDPVGYRTGQTFDPTGLARTLRYTNNADGSVKSQTLTGTASPGRSETTSFTYDAAGRQLATSVDNTGGTPATLTTTDVRDPRGLVTAETDPAGTTTGFGYD